MNLLPKWLRTAKVGDVVKIQKDCEWVRPDYRGMIAVVISVSKTTSHIRLPTEYGHHILTVSKYEVDVV